MDNTWIFQSLVIFGYQRECNKWMELLTAEQTFRYYKVPSSGFVNFDVKSDEERGPSSLQSVCARKIAEKICASTLAKSDVEHLPIELLAKIVNSVPFIVPAESEDPNPAAYKLNFETRNELIRGLKALLPEWDETYLDQWNQRDCVLYYSLFNGHRTLNSDDLLKRLKENDIHVNMVSRISCDWDNPNDNKHTKIFVIENNQLLNERKDLPKEIKSDDHPAVQKYGHLLCEWKEIHKEKRTEFTSQTLGEFKQYLKITFKSYLQ